MGVHGALRFLPHSSRNPDAIADTNTGNTQDLVDRLNVAFDGSLQVLSRDRNVAHLQCACQGAEQSTADGADHVVQRGRHILVWFDPVELLDTPVNAESHRLLEPLQIHMSQGASHPLDAHSTRMHYL